MLSAVERVQSATIVDRRSGPGYRIVLCRMTRGGTPVLETLDDSFPSVGDAERFARERLAIDPVQIRVKARTSA